MIGALGIIFGLIGPMQAPPNYPPPSPSELNPPLQAPPNYPPPSSSELNPPLVEPELETTRVESADPEYDVDRSQPSLSWDLLGGGTPEEGVLLGLELGFSRILEIHLEAPVTKGLLVGGWVGLDFGYWRPDLASEDSSVVFGLSGRIQLLHTQAWSIGVSAQPGVSIRLGDRGGWSLFVPVSARALYAVDRRLLVGATVDVPVRLSFPAGTSTFFTIPLTVGFAGEFHLMRSLAATAILGVGPALDTRGVEPALRATVGLGYRF